MTATYRIARLGAQGDGIAETAAGPVFIPFTLPGELVSSSHAIGNRVETEEILEASEDRVTPQCRHFGTCGGCALQHMAIPAYHSWKRDRVVDALRAIDAPVAKMSPCGPHSRRRAVFSARRTEAAATLGYHKALSNQIIDIAECPILDPAIERALPMLRGLAGMIAATSENFHLSVTTTLSGLDVAASGSGSLGDTRRRAAIEFAVRENLARLSIDGEIIVEPRKPAVQFGSASVNPPPGAFLQSVPDAEAAMAALVTGHMVGAKRVAELFAGSGTFSLRLASAAEIHAVEGDAGALAALDRAARNTPGLRRVTVEKRDLFRRPLLTRELDAFQGIVFDPPRAGAEDQSKQIARSQVPLVAAVSCNPTTLARDLEILVGGGYRVKSITPVDQFLWSPHAEVVALLMKPKRRR